MKRCLTCNERYASSVDCCPSCGVGPLLVDGFPAYAPKLAHDGGGFKASYFSGLARLEEASFWFRARNQLILWALQKYCPNVHSLLEIGCGTGYVLSGISKSFPQAKLYGGEIFTAGLEFAAARLPSVEFMQMDARNIPFQEEFDVIGAFDVLEHIADDNAVLLQVYEALKPGGFLLLTVPQHQWLWSPVDTYSCHERRYEASDLHQKIQKAHLKIIKSTSFVTSLLPAMMLSRFLQSKKQADALDLRSELQLSPWLNEVFFKVLLCESELIKKGCCFPLGGSRFVVAQKI